jgi:hypothetical protein
VQNQALHILKPPTFIHIKNRYWSTRLIQYKWFFQCWECFSIRKT